MSVPDVLQRVQELRALTQLAVAPAEAVAAPAGFSTQLDHRMSRLMQVPLDEAAAPAALPVLPPIVGDPAASESPGTTALAVAEAEIGQAEEPPGSNDGPRLADYRSAVAGAAPGQPWCAYFVSWAAAQAGAPLGDDGGGYGAVSQITDWASRTGRLLPAGSTPSPGDLILFGDRHVGIVESVEPDGSLTTVEGNYSNAVSSVHRARAEATGFVRL